MDGSIESVAHQQLEAVQLLLVCAPLTHQTRGFEISAHDLLTRGFAADFVVRDRIARHVYAHVRRAFVGAFAVNPLENRLEHGENLDIAIVIDRGVSP